MARRSSFNLVNNTGLYLTTVILSIVFIMGFCAYMVLVLNVKPINTVLLPPGMPGMVTSEVNMSARFWLSMWLLPFKGLFIVYLLMVVAWGDKSTGCSWFWFIMMVLVTLADTTSFVSLAVQGTRANGPSQKGNLANDHLYCCVHGDEGIEATGCPSGVKCFAPVEMRPEITGMVEQSDLKWNNDFKWLFWAGLAFVVYYVIFYTVVFTALCWEPSVLPGDNELMDPTNQYAMDPAPLKAPPMEAPPSAVATKMSSAPSTVKRRSPGPPAGGSYVNRYVEK